MRWMGLSSTEEDNRVYHNAKVLVTLRKCIKDLQSFYKSVDLEYPPFFPNQPHPRYFPYLTSFTAEDGTVTSFEYLGSLEDDPISVTYLAKITGQSDATGTRVVVKFVASYGKDVHELLAKNGFAPTLRYYGPLRGDGPSDDILRPTGKAPPGLRLHSNLMHMVVMDYIHPLSEPPPDAHDQVREVLKLLHENGYVFGDLRAPNVLFDANDKVKFIDFNWCGRYTGDGPFVYYPLAMSTIEDMWAPGMKPLTQIRPEHDLLMVDKLQW
jgi:hypothetical protein